MESAANVAISKLHQQSPNWQLGLSSESFGDIQYSVNITNITQDSTLEAKKLKMTTITTYADVSDTTEAIFMQPAYSYYDLYSRKWPNHLTFESGDTLNYPLHSNEQIRMKGTPVFTALVSSQANSFATIGTASPKFYGGAEFGNGGIPEPRLSALRDTATAGGDVHDETLWLTFNDNGSYQCSTSTVLSTKLMSDYNGTIMTTNHEDIYVKGVVNGKVTVISDRDLYIDGNIIYNLNPFDQSNSPDYTGLIAQDDIIISDNAATANGVTIQAALICKHEMKVENFNNGVPRGTLLIMGSVVQESAQKFGLFSGGTLTSGYQTVHIYDPRLFDKTPPFFPRCNRLVEIFRSD